MKVLFNALPDWQQEVLTELAPLPQEKRPVVRLTLVHRQNPGMPLPEILFVGAWINAQKHIVQLEVGCGEYLPGEGESSKAERKGLQLMATVSAWLKATGLEVRHGLYQNGGR